MSQEVGRQAASAKESSAGLGSTLRAGNGDVFGQRALMLLGQQRAARIERLVAGPVRRWR